MKNIIVFLTATMLLLGCKKEEGLDDYLSKVNWGWAKSNINGKGWDANTGQAYTKHDTIGFAFSRVGTYQAYERLGISHVPFKLGKHFARFGYTVSVVGDNDLFCADYETLLDKDSLQNWVDITEYNPETKEIKGKFSCNLLINPKGGNAGVKCKPTDPDTLRIRNGTFHTKITKVF